MDGKELCSVIIPCRNESKHIITCLDSIFDNDYSPEKLEIIIVDGMSDDNTEEIIKRYSKNAHNKNIKLIKNKKKVTPCGINLGIKCSKGSFVALVGAHNFISKNYLSTALKYISQNNVDCVGGKGVCLPLREQLIPSAIAIATHSKFGVGPSFRTEKIKKYVDTVPSPVYRRRVFERIGYFDEDLLRNQDDEFNFRLIDNGGKVLLLPEITSFYYTRDSLFKLWKMYYQYGYFKPLVARKLGKVSSWRQLIPAMFISSLIIFGLASFVTKLLLWPFVVILCLYVISSTLCSARIAIKSGFRYLLMLPVIFAVIHCSYGLGYLKGGLDFVLLKRDEKEQFQDIPLTR